MPRPVSEGDIAPKLDADTLERVAADNATAGARASLVEAVRDVVDSAAPDDLVAVAQWLQALAAAAPADDAAHVTAALLGQDELRYGTPPVDPDAELVDDWREAIYPYRNLMRRKPYEHQKYLLQVELLKLQAWVKETGQRVVILFEGRDAAGKGGT
ncbi:MAG TPA: hypothetical protein PKE32_10160, partial [Miltoncostaeaceae bacterium]|nr:hypothetical protein [Miltoncostaeaceae bacterium]